MTGAELLMVVMDMTRMVTMLGIVVIIMQLMVTVTVLVIVMIVMMNDADVEDDENCDSDT